MNGTFYRGEIYYVNLGNCEIGSEIRSGRPGIIVSNDMNNRYSSFVDVVYLTTKEKKPLPTHVHVESSGVPATALCEQVIAVDKSRLGPYIGTLTKDELTDVEAGLVVSLGLNDFVAASKEKTSDCINVDSSRQLTVLYGEEHPKLHSQAEYVAACAQRDAYKELCLKLIDRK